MQVHIIIVLLGECEQVCSIEIFVCVTCMHRLAIACSKKGQLSLGCKGRGRSHFSDAECIQVANKLATYKGGLELGERPWGPVYIPLTVKPHCNGRGFAYAS